jgi:hypothetical protein
VADISLVLNKQPEKALPYFLQIRKPNVFDLIRDYNLFTAIQSQALQLVDFDQERVMPNEVESLKHGRAIELLVQHTHSIPVCLVSELADVDRQGSASAGGKAEISVHVPGRFI